MYFNPNQQQAAPAPPVRPACKQAGCECRDDRVLNYRALGFFRAMAEQRGQTLDRVVPAGDLTMALLRPNESDVSQSEETEQTAVPPTCACSDCLGACSNVRTITHPTRCPDCTKGVHVR